LGMKIDEHGNAVPASPGGGGIPAMPAAMPVFNASEGQQE